MSDGSRLRQSWYAALNDAETHFRQLLTSASSQDWRRLSNSSDSSSLGKKGKARSSSLPELSDVVVHRNSSSGDDIYRLVLDVPTGDEQVSLEPWKAVLTTPELRQEWDPAVEEAHLMEIFDHTTRISKTNFSLGWPANPRDSVTISRTFHDTTTLIDISTSLPRSSDEPAYLRPSPPFVRSHVKLFAWCIQHIQPQPASDSPDDQSKKKPAVGGRIRITCFWEHDLKALWGFGSSSSGMMQQLSTMTLSLLKTVLKRGGRVPKLSGYGNGVSIERVRYQIDREALTFDYAIIPEDEDHAAQFEHVQGMDEVHAIREHRRLTRSIECVLPSLEGWDVQVSLKASSEDVENLPWTAHAMRSSSSPSSLSPPDQIILRLTHAALADEHSVLKVRVVIEVSSTRGLRLNGVPRTIHDTEERDPSSYIIPQKILQDIGSTADLSFRTASSIATSISSSPSVQTVGPRAERTAAAHKSILSRVRRSYIYFSSLLQEPEAKWRRTMEARGVSITQLDSIDPTLVVYRAEATFVGVGLWDLFGAVVSPGAKAYWDKQHEDAVLLEDVNDLTELWHFKTKPAWPVNGRDAVLLKTVYKSPTTIHVFAFSADDHHLFPNIPPTEPNVIRTQVDLQGWAIEALSPTTTLLTLLEQSDPKGWTNKTSIPMQMANYLAGIGEFAIKCGGPPVVTRLSGAKANEMRYEHERGSFKIEYEPSANRRTSSTLDGSTDGAGLPSIECEIRCDIDTWANSLDIVVDPPPQTITCLRRHRLSAEGGGLWITLTHDAIFVDDERLLAIVRRAPGKEKGLVMVNGTKIQVDVEELPEHEIKSLTKQKRVKPPRIPLDQPPVVGVIRRRKAEWSADEENALKLDTNGSAGSTPTASGGWGSSPRISSPLARFFTFAVDQATSTTQQAVAAISPANSAAISPTPSPSKAPMQCALEALAWAQDFNTNSPSDGWLLVSEKGMSVHRKLLPNISPVIPVHKGCKVIEGVSGEELASVIQEYNCRKKWDERFDGATVLESFGSGCRTSFLVAKGGFPFRDRGFYLASVLARSHLPSSLSRRNTGDVAEQSNGTRNAIFCVSASYNADAAAAFAPAKYNPYSLPIGRVYIDAWILETLDPYTKENYAIPSTRCTRLVALDFSGSIPAAVNSMINAALPRSILSLESYIKSISPLPITRLPTLGMVITDNLLKRGEDSAHLEGIYSWKLRRRDDNSVFVGSRYAAEERVYVATALVMMPKNVSSRPGGEQTTPRGSRMHLSPSPHVRNAATEQISTGIERPQSPTPTSSEITITTQTTRTNGSPGSPPPSPPPVPRARAISSTSQQTPQRERSLRGRASTSAFTLKGEVKPTIDLLVAELVIDSKLYPEGYTVSLYSRFRSSTRVGPRGHYIPLVSPMLNTTPKSVLPLNYTLHTMPSSPMHSSGLNAESPTRHLLRLTLPTAMYQIPTFTDPLTGETQSAPPKPEWLVELQKEGELGGAVVDVEVRPRILRFGEPTSMIVMVDGKEVMVLSEKESLTGLGREELLDDRMGKMAVLSRVPNESEPLSEDLKTGLGIADDLFDPSAVMVSDIAGGKMTEEDGAASKAGAAEKSEDSPTIPNGEMPLPSASTNAPLPVGLPVSSGGGLLGFLQGYPNPLTRFSSQQSSGGSSTSKSNSANNSPGGTAPGSPKLGTAMPRKLRLPGGLGDLDGPRSNNSEETLGSGSGGEYRLWTVVVVALIAFLIGSLLRSLISPADFIYVATDAEAKGVRDGGGGWREIRRLVEMKYVWGGWDLQVAVVRRH